MLVLVAALLSACLSVKAPFSKIRAGELRGKIYAIVRGNYTDCLIGGRLEFFISPYYMRSLARSDWIIIFLTCAVEYGFWNNRPACMRSYGEEIKHDNEVCNALTMLCSDNYYNNTIFRQ